MKYPHFCFHSCLRDSPFALFHVLIMNSYNRIYFRGRSSRSAVADSKTLQIRVLDVTDRLAEVTTLDI